MFLTYMHSKHLKSLIMNNFKRSVTCKCQARVYYESTYLHHNYSLNCTYIDLKSMYTLCTFNKCKCIINTSLYLLEIFLIVP